MKCKNCLRNFKDKKNQKHIKNTTQCIECYIYLQELESEGTQNIIRVSKEMALDAGMPETEGWEIPWGQK
jgi:hydrogenase maturation factor HypF (carbamoyltransferase family)